MARVVHPKGHVLICAEPDYGGRLDWPDFPIREWQIKGLRGRGANPLIGRRLRSLLDDAGLRSEVSVIPSHWNAQTIYENYAHEWRWIAYDVGDAVDPAEFERVKHQAKIAIDAGTRMIYVPTFCAFAKR
jgi:hypothetical protein